jgi:hypothetical protein
MTALIPLPLAGGAEGEEVALLVVAQHRPSPAAEDEAGGTKVPTRIAPASGAVAARGRVGGAGLDLVQDEEGQDAGGEGDRPEEGLPVVPAGEAGRHPRGGEEGGADEEAAGGTGRRAEEGARPGTHWRTPAGRSAASRERTCERRMRTSRQRPGPSG